MILKLVSAFMAGFMAHQVRPFMLRFAHGWRDLLLYATGVLCAAPFVMTIYDEFDDFNPRTRLVVAYFGGFFAFGLGVLVGWLHDSAAESE